MPSPKHPCAHAGCPDLVARKEAVHCRRHAVKPAGFGANVAAAQRGRILSQDTREKIRLAHSGPGQLARACLHCSTAFTVEKPCQKQRFCSRSCGYAQRQGWAAQNWNAGMPVIACRVCGTDFRLPAATVQRFTCSYACKNIWQRRHQRTSGTNIERTMASALSAQGIAFDEQVGLAGISTVDFYIPATRTAIFCDGDYWHSLPGKAERDQRQTERLQAAGFTVRRFLGSAILANVEDCLRHLSTSGI